MQRRRSFLKAMVGFLGGGVVAFTPLASLARRAWAATGKAILPKGTDRKSLINQNPASLDTRHLETTPLEDFGTMGLSDHGVELSGWRLSVTGSVGKPLSLSYEEILELWVDGKRVAQGRISGNFRYDTEGMRTEVGSMDGGRSQHFRGVIGRVKLYRRPLTPEELVSPGVLTPARFPVAEAGSARQLASEAKWVDPSVRPASAEEPIDDAAPPPRPISIDGPPSTTIFAPGMTGAFSTCERRMLPRPPAIMIGL